MKEFRSDRKKRTGGKAGCLFWMQVLLVLALTACTSVQPVEKLQLAAVPAPSAVPRITLPAPSPAPTQRSSPSPVPAAICSPLQGFDLAQMPGLVSNPYHPPAPGSDDPHHGIDLADMLNPNRIALAGRSVQAVLDGRVSTVINDRFPFGNAVIVETPLENLPTSLLASLSAPALIPTLVPHSALTCPAFDIPADWDLSHQSLYLLYAHLQEPVRIKPGDKVACGQGIGVVGQSGNALNPHLHLEVRVGPAGAQLGSLAHYDVSATTAEMAAYCTWSISGLFQMIDPLKLLNAR